jgi:tRNA pseudouridine55 synthase
MFYLIDKPIGMTSFDVIRKLRKWLGIKKMWHTGTLDPLATWCILVATGNSTKLISLLDTCAKRYRFSVSIVGTSASLDLGTDVTSTPLDTLEMKTPDELSRYLSNLTSQTPPKYSALHIDWERAYDLAREGRAFDLPTRPIAISDVIIHTFAPPLFDISLTISSGGYIRSLAPVIGWFFWVSGGYITALRRTEIYPSDSVSLDIDIAGTIESPSEISYPLLFPDITFLDITPDEYEMIRDGKNLPKWELSGNPIGSRYFLRYEENFLSLCEWNGEHLTILRNNV